MCDETTADAEEIVRLEIGDSTRARLYDLSPTPHRVRYIPEVTHMAQAYSFLLSI